MANVEAGLTSGSQFGGYRIESFVARGGMGVVYKATQLALGRAVALKLVAPELAHDEGFRERFKREAQLAASLDHPNILPIYEAGEIDGQLFLAMRYVVGTDMDTLIQREHVLSPERATAIVAQVAGALDAAHSRGLVHRDVKPGNILVAEEYGEEHAYLTDFGLTKSSSTAAHLTRTGYMVGTIDYVAPEQMQGGSVDGRVDTYALACVLYRALTGHIPFERTGDVAKMMAHLKDPVPSASAASPAVSAELDAVIRRGMAKRPEERYGSAGEFARAARVAAAPTGAAPIAIGELERTEPKVTQVAPAPVTPRRRAALYGAGALAVLAIGAIIAVLASGGGESAASLSSASVPTAASTPTSSLTTLSASTPTSTTPPASAQAVAYHAQVARIIPRINAAFGRFPNGRDFGQPIFSRGALSVAADFRAIADDLDALSPPPSVLVDQEALVTHLHEMEQTFRSLATDSDSRDFSGARRDLEKSKVVVVEINASVRRLRART